jgi:general nucleoside transport system permease protein
MIDLDVALLASILRQATPIALATLGITLAEKSGVIHLAAEGVMLASAFASVAATFYSGSPWIGLLAGMATGCVAGVVMAVLAVYTASNQVVVGFGINLLAIGITPVLLERVWGNSGRSDEVAHLPTVHVPGLDAIPVLGPALAAQAVTFYLLVMLIIASWMLINRSVGGLRIRMVGEHALAAAAAGVRVRALRFVTVVAGCGVCGLGGAAISLAELGLFGRNMTGGRGFLAVAANVLGGWTILGGVAASLLFGTTEALQLRLQGGVVPNHIVQMLPYVITLVVVVLFRSRRPPASLGIYFDPEQR